MLALSPVGLQIISVRGKACAPQLMLLSIGFPDEKQLIGAYHKSRRDERPQTGAQAPGGNATTKEAPMGRQSLNVLYANQLDVLSPLRGFFSRHVPYRGLAPPSVVYRTSGAYLADNNNFLSFIG